jgi:anti-sigma B factor antagonist
LQKELAMSGADLSITIDPDDPHLLHGSGELDLSTVEQLAAAVREIGRTSPSVAVDLAGITFMDSTGLSTLLGLRRDLRDDGGDLVLAGASDAVRRVMETVQVWGTFTHRLRRSA